MNNSIKTVLVLLVGWTLVGCGRDNPASSIPNRKSHFERTVFTEPKYGNTITLISDKECEIKQGGTFSWPGIHGKITNFAS